MLLPQGKPRGSVVLLHGLTDSALQRARYLAQLWQQRVMWRWCRVCRDTARAGGVNGGGLGDLAGGDALWQCAKRRAWPGRTCRCIWSVTLTAARWRSRYALDSLEDNHLRQPQQIILLSPMIGVTAFARFAGLAGLPSIFPAFARAGLAERGAWV